LSYHALEQPEGWVPDIWGINPSARPLF